MKPLKNSNMKPKLHPEHREQLLKIVRELENQSARAFKEYRQDHRGTILPAALISRVNTLNQCVAELRLWLSGV